MQTNMDVLPLWVCRNLHDSNDTGCVGDNKNWTYYSSLSNSEECNVVPDNTDTACCLRAQVPSQKQSLFLTVKTKHFTDTCLSNQDSFDVGETRTLNSSTVTDSDYQITMKCTCGSHQPKSSKMCYTAAYPVKCTFQEKITHFFVFPRARHKYLSQSCNYGSFFNPYCLGLLPRCSASTLSGFFLFLLLSSILHPVHSYRPAKATSPRGGCVTARDTYKDFYTSVKEPTCLTSHPDRYSMEYYERLKFCARHEITNLNTSRLVTDFSKSFDASDGQQDSPSCDLSMSKKEAWNNTLFCHHFSWENLLSCNYSKSSCKFSCKQMKSENPYCDVEGILVNDQAAYQAYVIFRNMLRKYATPDNYSIIGNETECLHSYRSWICSQRHNVYGTSINGTRSQLLPCDQYCGEVEAFCPFFRIFNRTKLRGGQPAFICKGFDIENPPPARTKDCHYFDLVGAKSVEPVVTSPATSTASETTVHKIRHTDVGLSDAGYNSTTVAANSHAPPYFASVILIFFCFTAFSICVFWI